MAISYSWEVNQLTKKTQSGTDNVVVHCRWVLTGTESSTATEGKFNGATPLEYDPTSTGSFVPYEDLTKEDVVGWLQSIVVNDYWDHVTERIQDQIDAIDDPADEVQESSLPWAEPVSGSSEDSGSL
jgi:hypothetical protein